MKRIVKLPDGNAFMIKADADEDTLKEIQSHLYQDQDGNMYADKGYFKGL